MYVNKVSKSSNLKEFIELSWKILECKAEYYKYASGEPISDADYDKLEDRYRKLAKLLNRNPTACDMVGFDVNRPSCRLVLEKLSDKRD